MAFFTALLLVAGIAVVVAFTDAEPYVCETVDEITELVMNTARNRETFLKISIPRTMPEAELGAYELLKNALKQDSGFIRWNHSSTAVKKTVLGGNIIYSYRLKYRTTKEMDDAARMTAAQIVEEWNVSQLTTRTKIHRLRTYISMAWRYDYALTNNTANLTMSEGTGTCLGMTLASMLMLEAMDIPCRAVHGVLTDSGIPHIRLLVQIGKLWYTFDPVDLAQDKPNTSSYLKNDHGANFVPNSEYTTGDFRRSFPMTQGDLIESKTS